MTDEEKQTKQRELASLQHTQREHADVAVTFEMLQRQLHQAMLFLRDNTGMIGFPALVPSIGMVQADLGALYANVGKVRLEIEDVSDEMAKDIHKLKLELPE